MTKASTFSGGDVFLGIDREKLYAIGCDDYLLLPTTLAFKAKRLHVTLHPLMDEEGKRFVRVLYDGQKHRVMVPFKETTEALLTIFGSKR